MSNENPKQSEAEQLAARAEVERLRAEAANARADASFWRDVGGLPVSDAERDELRTLHQHNQMAYTRRLEQLRAPHQPPPPKRGTFTGTGAAPNPHADPAKKSPRDWTKDDIKTLREKGEFLNRLNAYRDSLPGGNGGLFQGRKNRHGRNGEK